MTILIYFPYNQRTVEQLSVMEMLVKLGHKVHLITLAPENELHHLVRKAGVVATASPAGEVKGIKSILTNARYLASYSKKHKIEIIIAHQQLCALPMIFASPFIKGKKFYARHNTDEDYKLNPGKARMMNRFINNFVKKIIAPSNIVYNYLLTEEKVPAKKLFRINYGYDFSLYGKTDYNKVREVKSKFESKLLLVSVARLVEAKRHLSMFAVIRSMVLEGKDCRLICLGGGHLKGELQNWIDDNEMGEKIFLVGVQKDVLNYIAAGDMLLHLSETEASNSVVKEAGLVFKPVIVCRQVGDFSDYIQHGENSFLVDKKNPVEETIKILKDNYNNKDHLYKLGEKFHQTVLHSFDIKNVESLYEQLINKE